MVDINVVGHRVIGESASGLATSLCFPSLAGGVVFDMGVCPREAIGCQTVFLTHGHLDHWPAIITHASTRELMQMAPSRFICPPWMEGPINALFDAAAMAEGAKLRYQITTMVPGDEIRVGRGVTARAFSTDHTLPGQGYILVSEKSKLKPEYVGLEGTVIAALRKGGTVVSNTEEVIEVAYCGDTRITGIQGNLDVKRAKLVVAEATFLGDTTLEFAHERGHSHLTEVVDLAATCEGHFLLIHFSARYSNKEIRKAVQAACSAKFTPFIEETS